MASSNLLDTKFHIASTAEEPVVNQQWHIMWVHLVYGTFRFDTFEKMR